MTFLASVPKRNGTLRPADLLRVEALGVVHGPGQGPGGEIRIDPETQYSFRTPRIAEIQTEGQFKVVWTGPEPLRPEPYPKTRTAEAWRAFLHDLYIGWGNRWAAPHADLPRAKQGH